jgi:hypothetical protein
MWQVMIIWTGSIFTELLFWVVAHRKSSRRSLSLVPIYAKLLLTRKRVWIHSKCEWGSP